MPEFTKADIINLLVEKNGFSNYLELCSLTTGLRFAEIDRSRLKRCHRIIYNCPKTFDDGLEITWRLSGKSLEPIVPKLLRAGRRYDLVLVDSFHTYACSARDLAFALSIVSETGIIVMHDASPPTLGATAPDFIEGPWAGQSYAAYIDFVLMHPELSAYVVDTDWGVAIIKARRSERVAGREALAAAWRALPALPEERFAFFAGNRQALLDLVSTEDFLVRERLTDRRVREPDFQWMFPPGRSYVTEQRPDFLRDLARVHIRIGNVEEARRLLEMALAERPTGVFIRDLLHGLPPQAAGVATRTPAGEGPTQTTGQAIP